MGGAQIIERALAMEDTRILAINSKDIIVKEAKCLVTCYRNYTRGEIPQRHKELDLNHLQGSKVKL